MPYSSLAIQIETKVNVTDLLSTLAREQFNARVACALDERQYIIDNSNDVRAIQQSDGNTFGFFCRYSGDIKRTEHKIRTFSQHHHFECKIVDLESVRKLRLGDLDD